MNASEIFEAEAKPALQFLVDEYAFQGPHRLSDHRFIELRYQNVEHFIDAYYDPVEREVNVHFGRLSQDEAVFSMHMFLGVVNPKVYYSLGFSIANEDAQIGELVAIYAAALRRDGESILRNDPAVYVMMAEVRSTGKGLCPAYYEQLDNRNRIISKYT